MTIRAAVADAKVRIAEAGLDLANVTGDAALEGGVLSAENATARVGKSRASGGKVLVGLAPGDGRLRVEAQVRADLAEVPAILARAIDSRTLREELALVEGLGGAQPAGSPSRSATCELEDERGPSRRCVSPGATGGPRGRCGWEGGEFMFDGRRAGVSTAVGQPRALDVRGFCRARAARGSRP